MEGHDPGPGRDLTNGVDEGATGGDRVYFLPGVGVYRDRPGVAAGVETPVWSGLNAGDQHQGAEGEGGCRLICSVSCLF